MKYISTLFLVMLNILSVASQNNALSVGRISGQFDVFSTGAATYTIPIECPIPPSGMVPKISLVYNSQGSDNIAGIGWGIGGISPITKGAKTLFSDNSVTGVDLKKKEKYSLNGNNLILVSGTYGSNNATYKLENNDFTRITTAGEVSGTVSYPAAFKVETKDGIIIDYYNCVLPEKRANTSEPAPSEWLPTQMTDINGNYIRYSYKKINGQTILDRIDYWGNETGGNSYMNIVFSYISKPETKYIYINEYYTTNHLLLSNITINSKLGNSEEMLKRYNLSYKTEDQNKMLTSINVVNGSGESIKETSFDWGNNNKVINVQNLPIPNHSSYFNEVTKKIYSAEDIDGDGISELIEYFHRIDYHADQNDPGYGYYSESDYIKAHKLKSENGKIEYDKAIVDKSINYTINYLDLKSINGGCLYMNLCGKQQKAIISPKYTNSGGEKRIQLLDLESDGTAFCYNLKYTDQLPVYGYGDINNDGIDEIIFMEKTNNQKADGAAILYIQKADINNHHLTGKDEIITDNFDMAAIKNEPEDLFIVDIDGDGLKDVVVTNPGYTVIYKNMGGQKEADGIVHVSFTHVKTLLDVNSEYSTIKLGDFNGDGYPDFILNEHCNSNWKLAINTGNFDFQFITIPNMSAVEEDFTSGNDDKDDCIIMDFNNDGKSDVIMVDAVYDKKTAIFSSPWGAYNRTEITWYQSTGNGFTAVQSKTIYDENYSFNQYNTVGDFDGDGRADLFSFKSNLYNKDETSKNGYFYTTFNENYEAKQIKQITDGLGNKIEITYRALTAKSPNDVTFYTKENNAIYPFVDITMPLCCVERVTQPTTTLKYSYQGALGHLEGKGFLGFKKTVVNNTTSSKITTSTTTWEPTFVLPSKQFTTITDYNGKTIFSNEIYLSNSKINGSFESNPLKTVETDGLTGKTKTVDFIAFDNYNNVLQQKIDYGEGITETIEQSFYNRSGYLYLIGQLREKKTTRNYNGENWIEKESWDYNTYFLPVSKSTYTGVNGTMLTNKNRWTYNITGNVTSSEIAFYSNPRIFKELYTYDSKGRLETQTNALGQITTYSEYNKWGEAEKVTDFKGNGTTYAFDNWGRKVSATYPDGTIEVTSVNWSSGTGSYVKTQTSTGKPTTITFYDSLGREIRSSSQRFDNTWINTDRQYDSNGNLQKESLPYKDGYSVSWNTYEYDTYNRPTSVTDNSGKLTSWDYSDNTVTETKDGITTTKQYDVLGQLQQVTDPAGSITYSYLANGQLQSVTAPGNIVTSFEYDEYGRQVKINDPSAGIKSFVYDASGNISEEIDATGKTKRMSYDAFNRLVQQEYVNELITDYTYNSDGQLASEQSNNNTKKEFHYDNLQRLSDESEFGLNGKNLIKNYTYENGKILMITYTKESEGMSPELIGQETYQYSNGIQTEILWNNASVWKLVSENSLGLPTTCHTGELVRTYNYNEIGNPIQRTVTYSNNILQDFSYEYSLTNGNLLWRKDNTRNRQENFEYDNLNRLVTSGGKKVQYDSKGNITSLSTIGILSYLTNKPYSISRITSPSPNPPFTSNNQSITYNALMRPKSISQGDYSASFMYNGDGDRIFMQTKKKHASLPTFGLFSNHYYFGSQYEVIENISSSNKEIFYIGGNAYDAPAVYVKNGNYPWILYYICRDNLGSITHLINASGKLVQELSYDAWGNLRNPQTQVVYTSGNEPELFLGRGYTGHEHLTAFGLINMNARLYDPVLGRFLSPDPYVQAPENSQNFNRYSYCLNNPLLYTDQNGKYVIVDDVIAAAFGAIFNLICNWNNLNGGNVWSTIGRGAAALGAGAIGGVGALYPEVGGWFWGGGTVGATNAWLSGSKDWDILIGAGVGVASSAVGGVTAEYGGQYVGNLIINGTKITSPVAQRAVAGTVGGAISGYASGFTGGMILTGDINEANQHGLNGLKFGTVTGAIAGTVSGYRYAKNEGLNLWNGSKIQKQPKFDFDLDPLGDNVTLYRGTTGSEGNGRDMFMTDNPEYAATYVKNGGQVVEVTISRFTLKQLILEGHIKTLNGTHFNSSSSGQEYKISPQIATEFIKRFKY